MTLLKIDTHTDNWRDIFNKYDNNFEYIESLLKGTSVRVNYERFDLIETGNIIKLSRPYQLNNNSIQLYVDGVRQHPDNFIELNQNTIQLVNVTFFGQVADIYYRESFELDSEKVLFDYAAIYTLDHILSVSVTQGRFTKFDFNKRLIIPSEGDLIRIIISPKEKIVSGKMNLVIGKSGLEFPLYPSTSEDSYFTFNPNTNSIVLDFTSSKGIDAVNYQRHYYVGDEINLVESITNTLSPLSNEINITYVIKQGVEGR